MDSYYDMEKINFSNDFTVISNISIIGNSNGTIFDYRNNIKGILSFYFESDNTRVTIENIIFINFYEYHKEFDDRIQMIYIQSELEKFYFTFNNCTFQNNYNRLINIKMKCHKSSHLEPAILLNECNFM
ncbi:hypothetical protein PIROE2DRAFT_10929 [Piromyces sp. E2]|nr:hypothetical protein PIROE2DRAFT_10929 [Piromyces sp. E2]|eukprot:OUM62720.1 hypothetical protein PIROE2DRAFT_10929 [Piromyces sp. E2]